MPCNTVSGQNRFVLCYFIPFAQHTYTRMGQTKQCWTATAAQVDGIEEVARKPCCLTVGFAGSHQTPGVKTPNEPIHLAS